MAKLDSIILMDIKNPSTTVVETSSSAFEVEYSETQVMLGHGAYLTWFAVLDAHLELLADAHTPLHIKLPVAGTEIDKSKFLDSLSCTDKSPAGHQDHSERQRHSAARKSKLDSLRRSVTVAIADAKCEITSVKEIKGASLRAAIKRARSARSRSSATSNVGGWPRVGGIENELKHSFPRIKEWRRR
ncbi:hypothetical protein H9P43_009731 [Blastocladiella emersonii ATCC 22665]|nr:hypothetical protein H9P43_009731 [Blastocladiella emersonii ATCC 22665]